MIICSCHTWSQLLQRLEKTYPAYETDLSVRHEFQGLPMVPERPTAARIPKYLCELV